MFVARGDNRIGAAHLRWACLFARRMWGLIVERHGLVLDTTFVPPAEGPSKASICIYLLVSGTWTITGEEGSSLVGPVGFVVAQDALEGASRKRAYGFRVVGAPMLCVQIYLKPEDVPVAADFRPVPFALDEALIGSATRSADLARTSDDHLINGMAGVLESLVRARVVRREVAEAAAEPNAVFERLWQSIRPTAEKLLLSPTLDELSIGSGRSVRQMERTIARFLETFEFAGTSWRSASRHLRIKLAVLFLSADGVTVADVAEAVGYGSTEAMARAFRDAALPAPSVIRAELLASSSSSTRASP
ncbi:hypothetical protein BH09MYX1_BH09MYX1_05770 [soil metagenome]